jgi:hypothetical protein
MQSLKKQVLTAMALLKNAAEKGHLGAAEDLGNVYLDGFGRTIQADPDMAYFWWPPPIVNCEQVPAGRMGKYLKTQQP